MAKQQAPYIRSHTTDDAYVAADGSRWHVDTWWAEIDDRAECVGVAVRSFDTYPDAETETIAGDIGPVRSDVLRAVSMSAIDQQRDDAMGAVWAETLGDRPAEDLTVWDAPGRGRMLTGRDGRVLSPAEALEHVAAVYRDAWRRGRPPVKAVAAAFSLSQSAAANRVRRAREAGLLPPTSRGRAVS